MNSKWTPTLVKGCRVVNRDSGETVILAPEEILRLNPTGTILLTLCDGRRSVLEIIEKVKSRFPDRLGERIEMETISFLERLRAKRVIDFL